MSNDKDETVREIGHFNGKLETENEKLRELLTEVYEREIKPELEPDVPCRWDHHRVCQTHWWTLPGEESVPGVGERPGPEEKCGFYDLADRIRDALFRRAEKAEAEAARLGGLLDPYCEGGVVEKLQDERDALAAELEKYRKQGEWPGGAVTMSGEMFAEYQAAQKRSKKMAAVVEAARGILIYPNAYVHTADRPIRDALAALDAQTEGDKDAG